MATILILYYRAVLLHRPQKDGQVVTMMRTTVSTQPQIIIVVCCITLRLYVYRQAVRLIFSQTGKNDVDSRWCFV